MRKTYIDNIRWITVVLVVIYHVIFMFNAIETSLTIGGFSDNQPQDVYQYLVYPWFMLLLFVVSGISARLYFDNHTTGEFVRTRTLKLLVPSTIGLFFFHWMLGYYGAKINDGFEWLDGMPWGVKYIIFVLSGQGVLWYIQLLWLFSMLLILIRKIEKNRLNELCKRTSVIVLILFTIVIFLSAQVLNMPYVIVYRFGIYGMGFLLGYFVFYHDEVVDRLSKFWIPLVITAFILAIVFTYMYWGQNYAAHEVLDTIMCNVFAWMAVLAIFAFMNKHGGFENKFSRWMNAKSWGLYIFHYFYITVAAYYLKNYVQLPVGVIYLITMIAAFICSYATYEIISRIPVLRWCILGIKKTKEKENAAG